MNDNWIFRAMCSKVDEALHAFNLQMEYNWYRSWLEFWQDAMARVDDEHDSYHGTHGEMCELLDECNEQIREHLFPLIAELQETVFEHSKTIQTAMESTNAFLRSSLTGVTNDMVESLVSVRQTLNDSAQATNQQVSRVYDTRLTEARSAIEVLDNTCAQHFEWSHKLQDYTRWRDLSLRARYQQAYITSIEDAFEAMSQAMEHIHEFLHDHVDHLELAKALADARSYALAMIYMVNEYHTESLQLVDLLNPTLTTEELEIIRVRGKGRLERTIHGKRMILTEFTSNSREVCPN